VLSVVVTNNEISGNNAEGLIVSAASQESQATCTIANNLIGTNAAGTAAIGNSEGGLFVTSVANCSVLDNVISANGGYGLDVSQNGSLEQHVVIQGNRIGTDETGQVALGNTSVGIYLQNETGNLIGGTGPGQGNVIANNEGVGIVVAGGQDNEI